MRGWLPSFPAMRKTMNTASIPNRLLPIKTRFLLPLLKEEPVPPTEKPRRKYKIKRPADVPEGFWRCKRCQSILSLEPKYFAKNKSKLGFDRTCRICLGKRINRNSYAPEGTRWCIRCEQYLPINQFRKGARNYSNICYGCKHNKKKRLVPPPIVNTGEKECSTCSRVFPSTVQYFYRNRFQPDGLNAACKLCLDNFNRRKRGRPEREFREGQSYCCRCKSYKTLDQFDEDNARFMGAAKYCKECSPKLASKREYQKLREQGKKRCKRCKEIFDLEVIGKGSYCEECRIISRREACLRGNRKYYERHKHTISARCREALKLSGLVNHIASARGETDPKASFGYTANDPSEHLKHKTFEKHIEQLQGNIKRIIRNTGCQITEKAVKIAIERIKRKSDAEIAESTGYPQSTVRHYLRLLAGTGSDRDYDHIGWAKPLKKKRPNFFEDIRCFMPHSSDHAPKVKKPKPRMWTREKMRDLEYLLRQGYTVGNAAKRLNKSKYYHSPSFAHKIEVLYLKFGRMMRTRQIPTDWTCGGKYDPRHYRYKQYRAYAVQQIKKRLGLHDSVIKNVILTMNKYNEPHILPGETDVIKTKRKSCSRNQDGLSITEIRSRLGIS